MQPAARLRALSSHVRLIWQVRAARLALALELRLSFVDAQLLEELTPILAVQLQPCPCPVLPKRLILASGPGSGA